VDETLTLIGGYGRLKAAEGLNIALRERLADKSERCRQRNPVA
jgi:hypothetical protein